METVNLSGLKNNPSEALRKAHQGVVVVLHRDKPDALMVGIELAGGLDAKGVKPALATALFRDGNLSLVRAARLAEMPLGDFLAHLSRLGIAVVTPGIQTRPHGTWIPSSHGSPRPERCEPLDRARPLAIARQGSARALPGARSSSARAGGLPAQTVRRLGRAQPPHPPAIRPGLAREDPRRR